MATAPKNINYDSLRDALTNGETRKVIARNHLDRVAGGLYRIRDQYESVWKMEADADGRQYITRADNAADDERIYVAEDQGEAPTRTAFKMVREGKVHVVWECSPCKTANITEFGNEYQCDNCHDKPGDVLQEPEAKDAWTRDEAREVCAEWVIDRMRAEGVSKVTGSLLHLWASEAQASPWTGDKKKLIEAKGGPWNKPWKRQKKDKGTGGFEKVKKQFGDKGKQHDEDDEG